MSETRRSQMTLKLAGCSKEAKTRFSLDHQMFQRSIDITGKPNSESYAFKPAPLCNRTLQPRLKDRAVAAFSHNSCQSTRKMLQTLSFLCNCQPGAYPPKILHCIQKRRLMHIPDSLRKSTPTPETLLRKPTLGKSSL